MSAPQAWYNENDPQTAAWLRQLIVEGHIAPGVVDERSIVDVRASDLAGFAQCHFFAGIGGWSYALRLAGWPDDRPVWTGSCPCQPFSAAGKRKGAEDERHLWPTWFNLIRVCRPATIYGEQVASAEVVGTELEAAFVIAVREGRFAQANKLAHKLARSKTLHYWPRWLDLVQREMEAIGYAFRPEVLGAHSVGAPHIRQRLWFVADSERRAPERHGHEMAKTAIRTQGEVRGERLRADARDGSRTRVLADAVPAGRAEWGAGAGNGQVAGRGATRELGRTDDAGSQGRRIDRDSADERTARAAGLAGELADAGHEYAGRPARPGEAESGRAFSDAAGCSPWSAAEFIPCTDGKARPVEPGTFPLAHGIPGRVGRLRAYGNAIVPQVAAQFILAAQEAIEDVEMLHINSQNLIEPAQAS